jgi:iron uptake system EfeUOB component EfeO/EfeM
MACACLTCVAAFLLFTALGLGGGSTPTAGAHPRPPRATSPLQSYSERDAERSGAAGIGGAPPAPELVPLPSRSFAAPIASYRRYAERRLEAMAGALVRLRRELAANRREPARTAWEAAYADYLSLGAVYGEFGQLNDAIDGNPGGLAQGARDPRFSGLHRIELGLWQGSPAQPRRLLGAAARLAGNVRLLRRRLPHEQIAPLEYATRAHEILEDAIRDLLSGLDVPWSHAGVLATAAGLAATRELIATLRNLLDGREDAIEVVDTALLHLEGVLGSLRRAHRERWPALTQLSQRQRELLDGATGAAAEALDQVPGALETTLPPPTPSLPRKR